MMSRREFLKIFGMSLGGIALVGPLTLNDALVDDEEDDYYGRNYEPQPPRPYTGLPYIMDFHATGNGSQPRPGTVGLTRSTGRDLFGFPIGAHLIYWNMNAYGGFMRWVPCPGSQLIITDHGPIDVWSTTPEIKAYALVRLEGINNFRVLES